MILDSFLSRCSPRYPKTEIVANNMQKKAKKEGGRVYRRVTPSGWFNFLRVCVCEFMSPSVCLFVCLSVFVYHE